MQLVHCLRRERDAAHVQLARLQTEYAEIKQSRTSNEAWRERVVAMLQDVTSLTSRSMEKQDAFEVN
jgi:hypothetical protein